MRFHLIDHNSEKELGLLQGTMQSLSSSGPIINIMALFPIIIILTGRYGFFSIILGSILGLSVIYSTVFFAKHIRSNGGYYSYVGKELGKRSGIFVSLMYISYAALALPAVAVMDIFFLDSTFLSHAFLLVFIIALLMLFILTIGFSKSSITMKYIVVSTVIEIVFMAFVAISLFTKGSLHLPNYSVSIIPTFNALPFTLLALSGIGSSIFISENMVNWHRNTHLAVILSYVLLAFAMTIVSIGISLFLSEKLLNQYVSSPLSIMEYIGGPYGKILEYIGLVIVLNGSVTLGVGYMNALKHALLKANNDFVFGKKMRQNQIKNISFFIILFSGIMISLVAFLTNDSYEIFAAVSLTMGVSFIIVHSFTNAALMKLFLRTRHSIHIIIPSLSILIFAFIILENIIARTELSTYFISLFSAILAFTVSFSTIKLRNNQYIRDLNFHMESDFEE